ncbi:hypothetical protein LXL04_031712 [Taraxacum kok-saghyz]
MKGEKNRWDPNGENLHPPPMCNARSALHRGISTEDTAYTRDGSCAELVGAVKPECEKQDKLRLNPNTNNFCLQYVGLNDTSSEDMSVNSRDHG